MYVCIYVYMYVCNIFYIRTCTHLQFTKQYTDHEKKIHDTGIFLIIFSQRTRCVAQCDATYWESNRANTMYRGYT